MNADAALIPYNSFTPVVKADNDDTIVDLWLRTKRNPAKCDFLGSFK